MDSTNWLVAGMIFIWVGGGIWAALRMGRGGHDLRLAVPLGLILGPFLAFYDTAPSRAAPERVILRPPKRPGTLDVLVGFDGSAESIAAAKAAVEILRPTLTSLTLATVLDYEDQGPHSGAPTQSDAYGQLVELALALEFKPTELELLYGPPAQTLADRAVLHGADLIVIGARGQGLTNMLLGSVATELVAESKVPVLIGPGQSTEDTHTTIHPEASESTRVARSETANT